MEENEQGNTMREMTIEEWGNDLRKRIKDVGDSVFAMKKHSAFNGEQAYPYAHSEMQANIMLAYRHLEDARMRVGKILQAYQGGVSILDK